MNHPLRVVNWPGFNQRVFTKDDLQRLCRRRQHKVTMLQRSADELGWYTARRKKKWPFINETRRRLEVAFLELAHGYLHGAGLTLGKCHYHSVNDDPDLPTDRNMVDREEVEADAVAAMCLIPQPMAEDLAAGRGLPDDQPYMEEYARMAEIPPCDRTEWRHQMLRTRIEFRLMLLRNLGV